MSRQVSHDYRRIANGDKQVRLRRLSTGSKGAVADLLGTVVAIREYSRNRTGGSVGTAKSLHVLEAENAELRNTAIELALEIQKLREAQ
jgi:hypothetical protein